MHRNLGAVFWCLRPRWPAMPLAPKMGPLARTFVWLKFLRVKGVKRAVFVPCQPMRGRKRGVKLSGLNNKLSKDSVVSEQ